MKKWTNAEFKAIDIRETASGFIDSQAEYWVITNANNKAATPDPTPIEDPEDAES